MACVAACQVERRRGQAWSGEYPFSSRASTRAPWAISVLMTSAPSSQTIRPSNIGVQRRSATPVHRLDGGPRCDQDFGVWWGPQDHVKRGLPRSTGRPGLRWESAPASIRRSDHGRVVESRSRVQGRASVVIARVGICPCRGEHLDDRRVGVASGRVVESRVPEWAPDAWFGTHGNRERLCHGRIDVDCVRPVHALRAGNVRRSGGASNPNHPRALGSAPASTSVRTTVALSQTTATCIGVMPNMPVLNGGIGASSNKGCGYRRVGIAGRKA